MQMSLRWAVGDTQFCRAESAWAILRRIASVAPARAVRNQRSAPALGTAVIPRRDSHAGLVFTIVGACCCFLSGDRLTSADWLAEASAGEIAVTVSGWLAGGNLVALGLIALLAGLAGCS